MKKLALLFAGVSLLAMSGCKDDVTEQVFPLVGKWQPIKEVRTVVETGEDPYSDTIDYTDCQKSSRWDFFEAGNGKRTDREEVGGACSAVADYNFSYTYDKSSTQFEIKYQGIVESEKGKVTRLDANTLNLTFEDTSEPGVYESTTITYTRIPQ
ncbi:MULTISPECIES: lipocalin family protein [unclassified Chryseobacterium]|uniref:lipocalin family protein n=1 Tax=unclassified Chryseobacterium TaxID=2593645 RepID=UPI0028A2DE0D|nr:lipocalin family protein [Chryseobacterium sp.]